ncbi:GDSL-type esterase/lipase family protein [Agarivorans sp. QJM3NY_25]|uniref:GDSL-type esterase/lipase family protein n=1 Tax=Agarivorans sp. QJM3NY_25 TaxID=3421430 RepID=UPI003D7D6568
MIKVLCFGDSNTWGYSPKNGQRLPLDARWPGVLGNLLGDHFQVIEEGQPGRTSYRNATEFGLQRGIEALLEKVSQQQPQWLVVMLGTNDLYPAFELSAEQVAANLQRMIVELRTHCLSLQIAAPHVFVLAPPTVNNNGNFAKYFRGASEKSKQLAKHYQVVAKSLECGFLDVGKLVMVDPQDGVHLNGAEHRVLASAVAAKLRQLI